MIDQWIDPEAWPAAVQEAVGRFEQGDLVERPSFFYLASARHGIWRLTRLAGDQTLPDELFELDPDEAPPYGMITTETCDLVEEDGEPRQPWISVAPVYRLENLETNFINLLRDNRVAYMRQLTDNRFSGEIWVADVRIEFPFEKSWLVGREPVPAFGTPNEKSALAEFLAARRNRPVLAPEIHTALLKNLRRWVENRAKGGRLDEVLAGVAEVRLAVSGSPLMPDGVSLIIISQGERLVSAEVRQRWDDKWEDWRARLEAVGIAMLPSEYTTLEVLPAAKYLSSFNIPLAFGT